MERYERPATSSNKPQRRNKQQSKNHHLRKRRPQKPDTSKTAIYVNTKTSTKSLLERCDKLIKSGEDQITIHCLGAAIQRGILVALKVVEQHVTFNIHTNTFTTKLIDDLEPAVDEADYALQHRFNSALRIKLIKTDPLEAASKK